MMRKTASLSLFSWLEKRLTVVDVVAARILVRSPALTVTVIANQGFSPLVVLYFGNVLSAEWFIRVHYACACT